MNEQVKTAREKMEKCLKSLEHELSTVRAGRANPGVLDKVVVDYYGTPTLRVNSRLLSLYCPFLLA